MKKKFLAVFVALLLVCLPLTACGESYNSTKVEGEQNTKYAVLSNGGSAVQFGNYVYYINGYKGYTNESGTENTWGTVDKGGLYRAELVGNDTQFDYIDEFGEKVTLTTFESKVDDNTLYNFVAEKQNVVTGYEKDSNGKIRYKEDGEPFTIEKEVVVPASDRIASKVIGTTDYAKGGIYIYGKHIFYATPSNHQNRDGSFETNKTMFFRTNLDGTGTIRLYTSENETNAAPYAFYYQGGKEYLTVQDGDRIISVTVGEKKVEKVSEIASGVTSVLFPTKSVYYEGINTNTVSDFIYYTRDIDKDDQVRDGNIVYAMRPSGDEEIQIFATGNDISLVGADGGYLFYRETVNGIGDTIMFTNLHNAFMGYEDESGNSVAGSPTYKEYYENASKTNGALTYFDGQQEGTAVGIENISNYTQIICKRPDKLSNQVYSYCIDTNGLSLYNGSEMVRLYSGTVSDVYDIVANYVYFGDGTGNFYRVNAFLPEAENTAEQLGASMNSASPFGLDVMGEFVMMFGKVDDYASDYALFVPLSRIGDEAQFVGVKAEGDTYDPSVELKEAEDTEEGEENE